jgi:hypothetical protein
MGRQRKGESGEHPAQQYHQRRTDPGAIEEGGPTEDAPCRTRRQQLPEPAKGEQFGSRGDTGKGVSYQHHEQRDDADPGAVKQAVQANGG